MGSAVSGCFAAVGLVLAGCSSVVGYKDLLPDSGPEDSGSDSWVAPVSGPDTGPPPDFTGPFVGAWLTQDGSSTTTIACGSAKPTVLSDQYHFTIAARSSASLVLYSSAFACVLDANVTTTNQATLSAQVDCYEPTDGGASMTYTYKTGTFTVDAGGKTAQALLTGTVYILSATGTASTCNFTQNDAFTKI